jgi:hypothetical protein
MLITAISINPFEARLTQQHLSSSVNPQFHPYIRLEKLMNQIYLIRLTKAMGTSHSLQICMWIPITAHPNPRHWNLI